uniref:Decapping nuclease n=1 Tax=Panagrolaimus davidi TaxID=227884 RepID=A0A914PIC9_9BILA
MSNITFNSFSQPLLLDQMIKHHFHENNFPPPNLLCEISRDSPLLRQPIDAKPIHISDFWLDRQRNVNIGREAFKYYDHQSFASKKKLDFNLSDGIATFDPRPLDEGLTNILSYILKITQPNTSLKQAVSNADFVCFRGTLTDLALTPYSKNDTGFKFVILKFHGVFFIMQLDTDAILEERAKGSTRLKRLTYWGQKFETFIFAAKGEIPDTKSPVSTWIETLGCFSMTLSPRTLERPLNVFYVAEVDGLDKSTGKYIEAKTTTKVDFTKPYAAKKSLRWWIQSYFAGIDKIILGTRSYNGIVKKLEWIKLRDIQHKYRLHWDPNVCMQSVYRILESVRNFYDRNVENGEMLVIERKPNSKSIHSSKVSAKKYPVLSSEFCKLFDRGQANPQSFNQGESWRPKKEKL